MLPAPVLATIDGLFARAAEQRRLPGVSYGVVLDGLLVHTGSVGRADLDAERPAASSTVFRIASMSKSFTAACVLLLRDEGALSLDDPAARWVPELAGLRYPTGDSPPLTLRMLLSMSSGLVEDDPWGDRLLDLPDSAFSALLAAGVGFDLVPATTYEYSNLGYAILGRIVARVAGEPLRELSRRRLFEPLGMSSTTWDADRIAPGVVASGYSLVGGSFVVEPPLPDGAFGAMGGLASSVEDLARWVGLHLSAWPPRDGPEEGPLSRSTLREMAQPASLRRPGGAGVVPPTGAGAGTPPGGAGAPPGPGRVPAPAAECYCFGLAMSVEGDGTRSVGHSGGLPGFGSHMEWLPDHGVGIAALANRTYAPMRAVVREALHALRGSGDLSARRIEATPELLEAKRIVSRSYDAGAPLPDSAVLPTYELDRDDDRRPPDFAALRSAHGRRLEEGELLPSGRLVGSWSLRCERGELDVSVMLGPTLPHRIQFVIVKSSASSPSS